jgi:two-component sensor histidine kinase
VEFPLRELLASTLHPLLVQAHQKGLELVHLVSPDTPERLLGDRTRLVQVINNLVSNAIKFTETGEVSVEIAPVSSDDPAEGLTHSVSGNPTAAGFVRLLVSVRATGIGIPADKQSIIFDSFTQADSSTTRKFRGTGLGLSISSRLVRLMNGEIWVSSEPGHLPETSGPASARASERAHNISHFPENRRHLSRAGWSSGSGHRDEACSTEDSVSRDGDRIAACRCCRAAQVKQCRHQQRPPSRVAGGGQQN